MLIDLDRDHDRAILATRFDVCVVGGGPVGLTMATELVDRGCSVVVLESGDIVPRASRSRLAAGEVVGDERFGALETKVHRALGGTSWLWENDLPGGRQGVRHTVIEPAVLERHRDDCRDWPFAPADLAVLTTRALRHAGLGVGVDDLQPRPSSRVAGLDEGRYVFGERSVFQAAGLGGRLAERATVVVGATVVALVARRGAPSDAIDHVVVTSPGGRQATVRATSFVLASGTVENTRFAWMLGGTLPGVRANRAIGVGVMDRPRLVGTLHLDDDPAGWMAEFGVHDEGGVAAMSRWLVPADPVRAGSPSAALLVAPTGAAAARRRRERAAKKVLVASPTVFEQRIADHVGPRSARLLVGANQRSYGIRSWAYRRLLRTDWDLEWSTWPATGRAWRHQRTWSITAIVEQLPHPANRLELADTRDVHGRPLPRLVWGRPIERHGGVDGALALTARAFAAAGIGRIEWPAAGFDAVSSCHLMGSLPIGEDPLRSAADPTGRLRGAANVFLAGSCLFPTGGHSNPTLTALALAIGTADAIAGSTPGRIGATAAAGPDTSGRPTLEAPASAAG